MHETFRTQSADIQMVCVATVSGNASLQSPPAAIVREQRV